MKKVFVKIDSFFRTKVISMRVAVIIMLVLSVIVPLFIAKGITLSRIEKKEIRRFSDTTRERIEELADNLSGNENIGYKLNESTKATITQMSYSFTGRMMVVGANYAVLMDTYKKYENKTLIMESVARAFAGETTVKHQKALGYVEVVIPVYSKTINSVASNDGMTVTGVIVASCSDDEVRMVLSDINNTFNGIIQIAYIVAIFGAIVISHYVHRPIGRLTSDIRGITNGATDNLQVENHNFGEVKELSLEVNKMLERLKKADDVRQEFVSNVSHELKTPITSIKVLADALNGQENVEVEVYKDFMKDISEEIDRESKIIEDLLTMVRMDKAAATFNATSCNVNELVELVLKRLKPIAAEKNIELVLESFRPVVAEIDEVKMTLVITNLVENAIKYNVANGWVRVSINADHKYFFITVSDSGIGIPKESQDMIFERFYRVDKARSRQSGGTGLGLAITKNAVLIHRGEIKVASVEGEGSTFTVRIPLTAAK